MYSRNDVVVQTSRFFPISARELPFAKTEIIWTLYLIARAHLSIALNTGFLLVVFRYVPSAQECPLLLRLPSGEISSTNAFISPVRD